MYIFIPKEFFADMIIGDVLKANPEHTRILMEAGMYCLGCPFLQMESLGEACAVHGLDLETLLVKLNA